MITLFPLLEERQTSGTSYWFGGTNNASYQNLHLRIRNNTNSYWDHTSAAIRLLWMDTIVAMRFQ
jgi:hypothetical protein